MTRTVLVPSSLSREAEDKREATRKLGYVARAAAVFRVDRLVVYPDPGGDDGRWGDGFVRTVLAYAATPPHLRKDAWGKRDELEYVGVLPPLRVSSQTGSGSDGSGSLRQGIVTEVGSDGRVRVNCGMQHPISLLAPDRELSEGERVTIRVSSRRPVRAKIVDGPTPGFSVERTDLSATLARPDAGLRIAASRHGEPLTIDGLGPLSERIGETGLTVVFGAPDRGLPEILDVDVAAIEAAVERQSGARLGETPPTEGDDESAEPDPLRFDLWLNTVPNQGSAVVRTEEAMFATLACLNLE